MRQQWILSGLFLGLALGSSPAEITGRVVNDGRGVVGATVTAVPYETPYATALRQARGGPDPSPLAVAATAFEGRFKLETPRNSPAFEVRVAFGGLASRTVEGVFEGGDSEELGEISLPSGETLSGRVVDQQGKPVEGARVRMGRDGAIVTTNRDGLFRLDDQALGSGQPLLGSVQRLSVEAAGFEIQPVARPRSGAPLAVKLKPSSQRVSGTLRDWNGKPRWTRSCDLWATPSPPGFAPTRAGTSRYRELLRRSPACRPSERTDLRSNWRSRRGRRTRSSPWAAEPRSRVEW